MSIPIFQVDAFSSKCFGGNPAAVCPLEDWLPDEIMLSIALENNLSETAFVNINTRPFSIRWFTPTTEVDLCGHATLASARILFDEYVESNINEIIFSSNRGELRAFKENKKIFLDFPADTPQRINENPSVTESLGLRPQGLFRGTDDILAILQNEHEIREMKPDFNKISELDCRGLIISAKGNEVDFVSRFFGPNCGINEDPVTGSAHTLMVPYWSGVLNKEDFIAKQLSARGGQLECKLSGDRVLLGGDSYRYLEGAIEF